MTETPLTDAADAPAAPASGTAQALAAFLRGIERRGAVFSDLLAGHPVVAEHAFAVALRHFRTHALAQPFPQWPRLFWRTLLAAPQLRAEAPAPHWPVPFAALATLGSGPRAALLLRLVAGLTDADAASALGVAAPTYRLALQRALPRGADGQADPQALRALGAAAQDALRSLPAERLAHLARLRQAAVQGRRPELIGTLPPAAPPDAAEVAPSARIRPWLWAGLLACALGLLATFMPLGWFARGAGDPSVQVRPLPAADAPAARFDAAFGLLTGRDFDLLAAPPARAPADDPAFYAWVAAARRRADGGRDPAAGMRDPIAPRPPSPAATGEMPESTDAP